MNQAGTKGPGSPPLSLARSADRETVLDAAELIWLDRLQSSEPTSAFAASFALELLELYAEWAADWTGTPGDFLVAAADELRAEDYAGLDPEVK